MKKTIKIASTLILILSIIVITVLIIRNKKSYISFEGKLPTSEISIINNPLVIKYINSYSAVDRGDKIVILKFRHFNDSSLIKMDATKSVFRLIKYIPNAFFYLKNNWLLFIRIQSKLLMTRTMCIN
jgi:hypothetical protein